MEECGGVWGFEWGEVRGAGVGGLNAGVLVLGREVGGVIYA